MAHVLCLSLGHFIGTYVFDAPQLDRAAAITSKNLRAVSDPSEGHDGLRVPLERSNARQVREGPKANRLVAGGGRDDLLRRGESDAPDTSL